MLDPMPRQELKLPPTPREAELMAQIKALRDALKPFDDAYRLSAKLCASQSLGDWEAMAKHHTAPGAYRAACIAFSSESKEQG